MTQEPFQDQEPNNDSFFDFAEDEDHFEEPVDSRSRWITVALVALATIIALILCVFGVRALTNASANEGYEDKSWVVTGTLADLTPDLVSTSNNGVYNAQVPADDRVNGKVYKSQFKDPVKVYAGDTIQFRGGQVGAVKSDFPEKADALIAENDSGQLEVVRAGKEGSLKPVTASLVNQQRMFGWGSLLGAVLILGGGIWGAIRLNRRRVWDDEESIDY